MAPRSGKAASMRMTRLALLTLSLLLLVPAVAVAKKDVEVQLLGLNDFHGHLEAHTPGRIGAVTAGGAEYLATHLRQKETTSHNSLSVSAGDLSGGCPLLSALFHGEPTIEAMNKIGFCLNAVGNHEFNE